MADPILAGYVPSNVQDTAVKQVERSRKQRQGAKPTGIDMLGAGFGTAGGVGGFTRAGALWADQEMAAAQQYGPAYLDEQMQTPGRSVDFLPQAPWNRGGTEDYMRQQGQQANAGMGGATKQTGGNQYKTESEILYQEAMDKMNNAQNIFNLLEVMQGETLSPEAQTQLQYLQEDTAQTLADIDYRLQQAVMREQAFSMLSESSRARTESFLNQGRDIVQNGSMAASAGISEATSGGMANVGRVFDQAASDAVNALPAELASQGDLTVVMGGAEHSDRRAQNEANAAAAATELQSLIEGNISDNANFSQLINDASTRAASATLDVMDIQDQKARMQAQIEMETGIRNEVYDLTTQRRNIERDRDRMERAIKEQDAAAQAGMLDRFGLGVDPSPEGMWQTTFSDTMESWMSRRGLELGFMEKSSFQQLATQYTQIFDKTSPEAIEMLANMSAVTGVSQDEIRRALETSVRNSDRVYKELSSGDFSNSRPGSAAFASLVYQTGVEMGMDPQQAAQLGNSPVLHEIINTMSNGRAGYQNEGTLRGLGGVPEDIYENYGYSWEEIKGDPRKEMEVFLAYLMASTGGDPSALASQMMESGALDFSAMRDSGSRSTAGGSSQRNNESSTERRYGRTGG